MSSQITESNERGQSPLLSICVPQFNRTSFLKLALLSYSEQTFRDFEVCISDGGSTDGRSAELIEFLIQLQLPFIYKRSEENLRYDPNLRSAISLSRGQYCLLMGNDDAINGKDALSDLWADIEKNGWPGVVINDSCDHSTGVRARRIRRTHNYGGGPSVAALHYRNFSFVSGVVLHGPSARSLSTDCWDGSEMYQTYLGCRIIALQQSLLERAASFSRKDLIVEGETVDGVVTAKRIWPCPITVRTTTLTVMAPLVSDAIAPYAGEYKRQLNQRILLQHLGLTMGYWMFNYRKLQSWNYTVGIALGLRPTLSAKGMELGVLRSTSVWAVYLFTAFLGLCMPLGVFRRVQGGLYFLAKSIR